MMGHRGWIYSLAIYQHLLFSGGFDRDIRLWHLPDGKASRTLEGHARGVTSLVMSHRGVLVSGSWDETIRWWRVREGTCIHILPMAFHVLTLAVKDKKLYVGGSHGYLACIELSTLGKSSFSPRIAWLRTGTPQLVLNKLNLMESLHLSEANQALCIQRGAIGQGSPSTRLYQPKCKLFQPMAGTADIENNRHWFISRNSSIHIPSQKMFGLCPLRELKMMQTQKAPYFLVLIPMLF